MSAGRKVSRKRMGRQIIIGTDEHRVNDEAVEALSNDPDIYQRGAMLVHIVQGANLHDGITRGSRWPRIAALPEAVLRERLSKVATFRKRVGRGNTMADEPAHPPAWCVKAIAQRGQWDRIRRLRGLVPSPILRPDGSILTRAGYDQHTGLYLAEALQIKMPSLPTRRHAEQAAATLLDVVCDFPFERPEHRSAWLAYVLTPFARYAFDGPAPLFLVDANVRGSGKTLLCALGAELFLGREMARMSNPRDNDEARKRITALALAGDPIVLIDNVAGHLGCDSLDAALTATVWKDRVLGESRVVELPLGVTWCASGNNVMLKGDMVRRVAHIRLQSPDERPEERGDFKHRDIVRYVSEHRRELVCAVLTILSAYCQAGRPRGGLTSWGSFEGWSDLVREAIVWCGHPDPGLTRQSLAESADTDATALASVLDAWDEIDPDYHGLTVSEIIRRLDEFPEKYPNARAAIVELCPANRTPLPNSRELGNRLAQFRRRVIRGRMLDYRVGRARQRTWRVVLVDKFPVGEERSSREMGTETIRKG